MRLSKMTLIKTIFLILLGLAIPILVLWRNIFPTFEYAFNEANENKIKIFDKTINGERYLILPTDENYFFNKVFLDINFKSDKLKSGQKINIDIAKDYEAVLYPVKTEIEEPEVLEKALFFNNPSRFPNGTIFSQGESVYFISQENYLPILDAQVFESLGFYWESVKALNMNDIKNLSKGEKINYVTPHPLGTILKAGQKYFLVGEKDRFLINEESLWEIWPDYNWVDIDGEDVEFFNQCSTEMNKKGKVKCEFDIDKLRRGNNYIFKFDQDLKSHISKAEVKLKVSRDWQNINAQVRAFLGEVKNRLSERYVKYL